MQAALLYFIKEKGGILVSLRNLLDLSFGVLLVFDEQCGVIVVFDE
jgi:hypothetical protein